MTYEVFSENREIYRRILFTGTHYLADEAQNATGEILKFIRYRIEKRQHDSPTAVRNHYLFFLDRDIFFLPMLFSLLST